MTQVHEVAGRIDPRDPAFIQNPHPTYQELRAECPVARSNVFGGFWLLSRYEDIKEAARNPELFSSGKGVVIPSVGNPMPFLPIELDPPEHAKYRRALQPWFSPREMAKFEPQMRELAVELIDGFIANGSADLNAELAGPIPPIVIALLLGLPRTDWPQFRDLAESLVAAAEVEDADAGAMATFGLLDYLTKAIAARRETPTDDILFKMMSIEIDGEPIPEDAVIGLAFFLLMAGHETSVGGISMMLLELAQNQELQQRLRDEPELIDKAVEESLRLSSPIQSLARTVEKDVCLHGVDLVAGDKVVLAWASANRDESVFENPNEFDLDRTNNSHVGFGDGIHRCLGSSLARLEMRVVIEEVLRRLPTFAITEGSTPVVGGILAKHARYLPVSW